MMKILIKGKGKVPFVIYIPNFLISPKLITKYISKDGDFNNEDILKLINITKSYVKENGHFTFIEVKSEDYYIIKFN